VTHTKLLLLLRRGILHVKQGTELTRRYFDQLLSLFIATLNNKSTAGTHRTSLRVFGYSVVTISKCFLSVGFDRFCRKKPRFSVRFRFSW